MKELVGVVRGVSSEDACARYVRLYLRSGSHDRAAWRPDPSDRRACLEAVRSEAATGHWTLRYTWRPPGRIAPRQVAAGLAAGAPTETSLATDA